MTSPVASADGQRKPRGPPLDLGVKTRTRVGSMCVQQGCLGMKDAFILGRANFRGMALTCELFLGDLYHQTVVSVDENGTFAAASTAADMPMPIVPTVKLNRPFIFLIRDIETETILFIGQVVDASER